MLNNGSLIIKQLHHWIRIKRKMQNTTLRFWVVGYQIITSVLKAQ